MNDARKSLRPEWLAAFAAAAAIGLAACGSGSSTPQVANVGSSSSGGGSGGSSSGSGGSATTGSNGNPAQLLQQWTTCMRSHGVTGQADPTIDASKVIHVTMSASIPGGVFGYTGQSGSGPARFCVNYLNEAQNALDNGHQEHKPPSLAVQLKYAKCMRANGVPQFPDPNSSGPGVINLGSLNPTSPTTINANKVCTKQTDWSFLPGASAPQPGDVDPTYTGNG